jgi:hypothetical protein
MVRTMVSRMRSMLLGSMGMDMHIHMGVRSSRSESRRRRFHQWMREKFVSIWNWESIRRIKCIWPIIVAASQLLLALLLSFCAALYLLSWLRSDGRSVLLESTPLYMCGPTSPHSTSTYCADIRAGTHYRFPPPFLAWPRTDVPLLLPSPIEWPLGINGTIQLAAYRPYPWPGLVVITYSSALYYDRLLNLLGSIHLFEPAQMVWVYDLGMTRMQRERLACMSYVRVRRLDLGVYPLHVQNLFNYAWKILVMHELRLHPMELNAFILMDSGAELSKPNALTPIKTALARKGFWGVVQSNFVLKKTSAATLKQLAVDLNRMEGKMFCAGGLIAFVVESDAYQKILPPSVACALDEQCIAPLGVGRGTHNYDQSILSAFIHQYGYTCEVRRQYREWDMTRLTLSPSSYNENVIALRRWHQPKPYASLRFLQQNLTDEHQCTFQRDRDMRSLTGMKHVSSEIWNRWYRWKANSLEVQQTAESGDALGALAKVSESFHAGGHGISPNPIPPATAMVLTENGVAVPVNVLLLEQTDGSYMHDHSPLMRCLRKHSHARLPCSNEIESHLSRMIATRRSFESTWLNMLAIDAYSTPLLRTMRMDLLLTSALLITCIATLIIGNQCRKKAITAEKIHTHIHTHSHAHIIHASTERKLSHSESDNNRVGLLLSRFTLSIRLALLTFASKLHLIPMHSNESTAAATAAAVSTHQRSNSGSGSSGNINMNLNGTHQRSNSSSSIHSHGMKSTVVRVSEYRGVMLLVLLLCLSLVCLRWLRETNVHGLHSSAAPLLLTHPYQPRRVHGRSNCASDSIPRMNINSNEVDAVAANVVDIASADDAPTDSSSIFPEPESHSMGALRYCSLDDLSCVLESAWQPNVRVTIAFTIDTLACADEIKAKETNPSDMNSGVNAHTNMDRANQTDIVSDIHIPSVNVPCMVLDRSFDQLRVTLQSLSAQRQIQPAAIYISIVHLTEFDWQIDQQVTALQSTYSHLPLHLTRSNVGGPFSILHTPLAEEQSNTTLLVLLRIGMSYAPLHLLRLVWSMEFTRAHQLESAVYGGCGFTFLSRPDPIGILPVYSHGSNQMTFSSIPNPSIIHYIRQVDVLLHTCGVAYRREYFSPAALNLLQSGMQHASSHCWHHSEIWITAALLAHSTFIHAPAPIAQLLLPAVINSGSSDGVDSTSPSAFNAKDVHISDMTSSPIDSEDTAISKLVCIRAVESLVGDWRGTMRTNVRDSPTLIF